jgi:hypothetical protein
VAKPIGIISQRSGVNDEFKIEAVNQITDRGYKIGEPE